MAAMNGAAAAFFTGAYAPKQLPHSLFAYAIQAAMLFDAISQSSAGSAFANIRK